LSYSFGHGPLDTSLGHGYWRYDEFRVSPGGKLVHEIEWSHPDGDGVWLIEEGDVAFSVKDLTVA
jgi:hypothetical protein